MEAAQRTWLESAAAFAACAAASVVANARLLQADVVSDDALVHQFWMRHWQDPALYTKPDGSKRAAEIGAQLEKAKDQLDDAIAEWEQASVEVDQSVE